MHRKFAFLLMLILLCVSLGSRPALAGTSKEWTYTEYLTDKVATTYEWSGTWTIPGTTGQNNPGSNVFNGIEDDKWGSYDIAVSGEEWVAVHFGENVKISDWTVLQDAGEYTNILKYSMQIKKTESSDWETVYTSETLNEFWREHTAKLDEAVECVALRFYVQKDWSKPGRTVVGPDTWAVELSEIYLNGYRYIEAGSQNGALTLNAELKSAADAISIDANEYSFGDDEVGYPLYSTYICESLDYFCGSQDTEPVVVKEGDDTFLDIANAYYEIYTFYDDPIDTPYSFSVKMKYFENNDFTGVFARTLPANALTTDIGEHKVDAWHMFEYDYYTDAGGVGESFIGAAGVIVTPVISRRSLGFKITIKQYADDGLRIANSSYVFDKNGMLPELSETLSLDEFFTIGFVDNGTNRTYVFVNDILLCCIEYSGEPVVYNSDEEDESYEYYPTAAVMNAAGETVLSVNNTRVLANDWICGVASRLCHMQIAALSYGQGDASQIPATTPEATAPATGSATAASTPTKDTASETEGTPAPSSQGSDSQGKDGKSNTVLYVVIAVVVVCLIAAAIVVFVIVKKKKVKK